MIIGYIYCSDNKDRLMLHFWTMFVVLGGPKNILRRSDLQWANYP